MVLEHNKLIALDFLFLKHRTAVRDQTYLWNTRVIPYVFDPLFSEYTFIVDHINRIVITVFVKIIL